MNQLRTVDVGGDTPYTIAIGPGLLADGAALAQHVRGRHVLLVSDSIVAPLYAGTVREALHAARPDLAIGTFILPAGEESKTLAHFGHAIDALATLAETQPVIRWGLELIRGPGLDLSRPSARAQLATLVAGGVLKQPEADALLALSRRVRHPSWAEANGVVVDARAVGLARGGR